HVHMVRGVLHDVVHHVANLHGKSQVHGGGDKGLGLGPCRFVVVPRNPHMGVVNIHHETNHGVPKQEGHKDAHQQGEPYRLTCGDSCIDHDADPYQAKHGDQQTVFEENRAARWHVRFVRKELTLPPNFNKVIQAGCPAAAVEVLHQAANRAELCKLFCREGCPNKVNTFQVGVAVVHHVVTGVPQAEWRERVQVSSRCGVRLW
ncbi:MAG: hypothetical protein RL770_973, partial [Pseudomonadota bacterium]